MDRRVAVFDLDAVFPRPLTSLLVERLVEKELIPEVARKTPAEPDGARLRTLGKYLKGLSYDDAEEAASELVEEYRGKVLGYPMGLVFDLKSKGYFLLAISGAPRFIVDGFAYEAGFDKSYGSFFETGASDRFTGVVEDEDVITNRAAVLTRASRKENLSLRESVGLAGSGSFIPMLEMVETPIAYNPDTELRARAEKRGWKIVLEDEGVVYKL